MSLINGTLIPYPAANGLVASDIIVNAGDSLGFVVTYPEDLPAGAPIYCVVVSPRLRWPRNYAEASRTLAAWRAIWIWLVRVSRGEW